MEFKYTGQAFNGINNYLFLQRKLNLTHNIEVYGKTNSDSFSSPIVVFDPSLVNSTSQSDQWASPNNDKENYFTAHYKYFTIEVQNYTIQTRTDTGNENWD